MKIMELIFILTYECNFRCTYCDIDKRDESISQKLLQDSIVFLEKNNFPIKKVKFFWGEPLLKKDYIKYIIANFPKSYNPDFYITSNSTLIEDQFIAFIEDNNVKLTFSLDGDIETTSVNRLLQNWKNLSQEIIKNSEKYSNLIRVNQVITSKNAKDFFKNFLFIYNLWVTRFNFLPEYYAEWSKEGLGNLKRWFHEIKRFYNEGNRFELINLENYSKVAFFNLGIIIDTDWKIYGTNLILSWIFEKYKKDLVIGDIHNWLNYDIHDKEFNLHYQSKINRFINKEYSPVILKSVKYVDLILNDFCYKFHN